MKKTIILAVAVFVILVINISTVRANTQYESGLFIGATAIMEADAKVYSASNFNSNPFTILKKGSLVTIISMRNPEQKYHWVLVEFDGKAGWIHVTPTFLKK